MRISLKCPKRLAEIFTAGQNLRLLSENSFASHDFAELELRKSISSAGGVVCVVLAIKMLPFPTKLKRFLLLYYRIFIFIKDSQRWFPVNSKVGKTPLQSNANEGQEHRTNTQKNLKTLHLRAVAAKNKVLYCQCQRSVPKQAGGGVPIVSAAFRPALSTHTTAFPACVYEKVNNRTLRWKVLFGLEYWICTL